MVKPHHRDQPFSRITLLLNPGYDPSMRQFGGHMRGHLVLGMLFTCYHCVIARDGFHRAGPGRLGVQPVYIAFCSFDRHVQ